MRHPRAPIRVPGAQKSPTFLTIAEQIVRVEPQVSNRAVTRYALSPAPERLVVSDPNVDQRQSFPSRLRKFPVMRLEFPCLGENFPVPLREGIRPLAIEFFVLIGHPDYKQPLGSAKSL